MLLLMLSVVFMLMAIIYLLAQNIINYLLFAILSIISLIFAVLENNLESKK